MSTAVAERPVEAAPKPKPDRRKAPRVEFEIERNDWCEILSDAMVFAGKDDTLPMLTCVRVRISKDGQIVATATDRFSLGRRMFHLGAKLPHAVEVVIPRGEVEAMARIHAKPRRGIPSPVQITVTGRLPHDAANRWDSSGGSVRMSSGVPFGPSEAREVISTHPCMDVEFVDIDSLIDSTLKLERDPAPVVGFNPEYLTRFSRVSHGSREPMRITLTRADKPMIVRIGEHFTGLVMPTRMPDAAVQS